MAAFAKMQELIAKCGQEENARIVPMYHEIVKMGFEANLLYKRTMVPKSVGVHRRSREGTMVSGAEAMRILSEIDAVGVAPELFRDATCFEEPQSKVNAKALKEHTAGDKFIADVNVEGIQASSVACSHFNQALIAVQAGLVPSDFTHGSL